jgi:hypothetical protein
MQVNGIDLDGLGAHKEHINIPEPVQGRVVHVDADFLAYQCSAEKADGSNQKSFDEMKHNAGIAANTFKLLAGATKLHLHLTPAESDKGGRYDLAIQKEYQGNRKDRIRPRYLHLMRDWLASAYPSTNHLTCEADDGMSSNQYDALQRGHDNLSVIASKDKDLLMVPGLHMDWDTAEIDRPVDDFGTIWIDDSKSAKKIKGLGHKFFWSQMLTGDTADNIQGIPKAYVDGKLKACGAVLAESLLRDCTSNKDAFEFVKGLYEKYGQDIGFKHWKTGEVVTWQRVFVSEAQLLWMRRVREDHLDVVKWLKEINQ